MSTKYDNIDAMGAKAKPFSALPTVYEFYEEVLGQEASPSQWQGGEMVYLTTHDKIYIQTATSGTIATWKTTTNAFDTTTTTTTTTSTTTSSTTTSSTSTSSTTTAA